MLLCQLQQHLKLVAASGWAQRGDMIVDSCVQINAAAVLLQLWQNRVQPYNATANKVAGPINIPVPIVDANDNTSRKSAR